MEFVKLTDETMAVIVREAREWLMDAGYTDVDEVTDQRVIVLVNRLYDGGWRAFESDNATLSEIGDPGALARRLIVESE